MPFFRWPKSVVMAKATNVMFIYFVYLLFCWEQLNSINPVHLLSTMWPGYTFSSHWRDFKEMKMIHCRRLAEPHPMWSPRPCDKFNSWRRREPLGAGQKISSALMVTPRLRFRLWVVEFCTQQWPICGYCMRLVQLHITLLIRVYRPQTLNLRHQR